MITNKDIKQIVIDMAEKEELFISDVNDSSDNKQYKLNINSLVVIQTRKRGKLSGLVICCSQKKYMVITDDDIRIMTFVVEQMAGALERIDLDAEIQAKTAALEKANNELGIKNEFKSKYLANMSHEIRTPLNSILGFIQLLQYSNFDRKYDILEINDHLLGLIESNSDIRRELAPMADYLGSIRGIFNNNDVDLKYLYFEQLQKVFESCKHSAYIPSTTVREFESMILEVKELLFKEDSEIEESLLLTRKSGEYLLQIINAVLDIAKIEAGRIEIKKEKTNVSSLIHELSAQAESYITQKEKQKSLQFNVDFSKNIPSFIYIDKNKFSQIVLNLISNAVKFTDKGSVTLGCLIKDANLVLSVQDTGTGIKKNDLPKLFKEFSRLEEGEKIEGTGLGLVYTRKLVELFGGSIDVDSLYGKGSTFTVSIPDVLKE